MPVTRKQQILAKTETSEGTSSSPGAGDAVLIYEPQLQDSVDINPRVPSGPTLSRDFTPVGRTTRQLTFKSDFRGSGSLGTAPDFARFLLSCGYKQSALYLVTITSTAPTLGGIMLGEIVQDGGGARGVVVALSASAVSFVPITRLTTGSGVLVIAMITGTWATGAFGGESSSSLATTSAVTGYSETCYQPDSQKLMNVTTGSWTGTPPAAEGEVLAVENGSGVVLGHVQVIVDNGSMTDMDVTQLHGTIANGNRLRSAGGGTATISAAPVMTRTPSLTIAHNLDGRRRDLLGSRGTFQLDGDVGSPMQFSWSFSGDIGPAVDTPAIVTTGLSTIRPPRLFGAIAAYGLGAQIHRITTKRVGMDNAGTVNPNLDVNRAGGATGSNVTDRDPSITVTVDQVHSGFDWEAARNNGTPVRFSAILGTVQGQIVGIAAPICQVTEVAISDADGVATFDVTLKPRRVLESGDDEVFLFML